MKKAILRRFGGATFGRQSSIGWFSAVSAGSVNLGDHAAIRGFSIIRISGALEIGDYSEISSFNLIYGSADLHIGRHSYIGPQSLLNVDEPVRLGDESALGPRSMVFTHGSYFPFTQGYWVKLAGVDIGDRVWCAARVFLHPGAKIGDHSFVNSGSVVSGVIPAGSVVEGNPAKVIYPMARVKRKMTPARVDASLSKILHDFAEIELRRPLGIVDIQTSKNELRFAYEGHRYLLAIVTSSNPSTKEEWRQFRGIRVYLVNHPDWEPGEGTFTLDLTSLRTPFGVDVIHTKLRLFMKRYYGIKFEDQNLPPAEKGHNS